VSIQPHAGARDAAAAVDRILPRRVRKRLYRVAKRLLPFLGTAGILVAAIAPMVDDRIGLYVLSGFAIASGVLHGIADENTDLAESSADDVIARHRSD